MDSLGQRHHRIGDSDVDRLEARTRAQRAIDYRSGGGSSFPELPTLIHDAHHMLGLAGTEATRGRLHLAVADVHNLTGWVYFDIGLPARAQAHFSQALALAGQSHDDDLVANVFYRLGRVCLHHGDPAQALEYFDFGQLAADRPGGELTASILSMNQAWAHAKTGAADPARLLMERATDQFGAADHRDPPDWARFFTETEMLAMTGAVHTTLAGEVDPRHTDRAIPALTEATDRYGRDMARSLTFGLLMLAENHLLSGDVDDGVDVGFRALASAESLTSTRVRDRMRPLRQRAEEHHAHSGARELAVRIDSFNAATTP
ncbi:tetratricopeptide repeat protein [Actinocrispum wychmicini]|uniref:Tetratricopeptide repeat protein n=1 Tax=Actinocrispum wychmicini TaxID=1213861 RepID=A0A4R2ITT1_9PSEU|nr:tetratricopeptide repeat protein [Actinocrispum wychmicini]TCO48981.1 tetratricopeptide repeat protein [Actinocrispum wychmicini]